MIIGLSGYAQTGKDTVAKYLVEEHGFTRIAFADAIRDALYALDPLVPDYPAIPGIRLSWVVDRSGWEQVKQDSPEVRRMLQRFGTEVARNQWDEDFWVKVAMNKANGIDNVVIADVRFPNEYDAIKASGGQVWRVQKLDNVPVNNHASETALDGHNFDWVIPNYGTHEDLYSIIDSIMKS
jgi:tRNA uridine 5-carbamoylmethylation protein Kti12